MPVAAVPVPLARGVLTLLPASVVARMMDVLVQKMATRRPRLFHNLARMEPAIILIVPTDVPHAFLLHVGIDAPFISVAGPTFDPPKATIRATLAMLMDMLEGRSDGDTLFFARDISVTGDTEAIVELRNTLDREEINLMEDALSLAGPFAGAARVAVNLLGHASETLHRGAARFHDNLHTDPTEREAS